MDAGDHRYTPTLEGLYGDNHPWLFGWLRRHLGNAPDAADLAHDTFVRLMSKSAGLRFANIEQARGFLRTTAKNLCINMWHRQEIERAWIETLSTFPESHYPSAERQAIVLEALQEIGNMLYALPDKAARAFTMAVVCQMTDQEVATELGVSDRMVRKYVAQGMLGCLKLRAYTTVSELHEDGAF